MHEYTKTDSTNKLKKTRYRVPTVCSVCRRRKMKCDKAKPHCSSCVKNNTTHLCLYEDQPWAMNTETQKLKEQIFILQQQNNELKKLLSAANKSGSSSDTSNTGLELSNFSFILPDSQLKDPVVELTEEFDLLMLKENKMTHYGSTSYIATVLKDPILRKLFRRYLDYKLYGIDFEKYYLYDEGVSEKDSKAQMIDMCHNLSQETGSVFESEMKKNHEKLIDQINEILPDLEIIEALIDNFFNGVYIFTPFVDEKSFRANVRLLLTTSSSGKTQLNVQNVTLLVSVSILLTVMRLSFLSLPLKKQDDHTWSSSIQKILKARVQISPSYIEFSKACIANAGALRKPTLKHIQAVLILRMYRYYAPEDGDESTDSSIFLSLIIQMARMHGIHRDPTRFVMVSGEDTILVWRKIWYELMYLDACQALNFGCPLIISDDEYDTMLPTSDGTTGSPLEKTVIDYFRKRHEITLIYRDIIKSCSKVHKHPKRSEIEEKLRKVDYTLEKYRSIEELTNFENPNESDISKIIKSRDLTLKLLLYVIHYIGFYILLLTCEADEIRQIERYTNSTLESCLIIFKVAWEFATDPSNFGKNLNFEPYFCAYITDSSKRVIQAAASFTARDMSNIFSLEKSLQKFTREDSKPVIQWLNDVDAPGFNYGERLLFRMEEYLISCAKLSNKYFVCWRVTLIFRLFTEYLDYEFPGRYKQIQDRVNEVSQERDSSSSIDKLSQMGNGTVSDSLSPLTPQIFDAEKYWNQFVDSSSQANFDYLVPDLTKFNNVTDPFIADSDYLMSDITYQDLDSLAAEVNTFQNNSLLNDPNRVSTSSNSHSNSNSNQVSPDTDTSSFNGSNYISNRKNIAPTDQEIAMQVASQMFGGGDSLDLQLFNNL